jgi:hypothetical protein
MSNDQRYLDQAIEQVTGILQKKRTIWGAEGDPVFENFDLAEEFDVISTQFGLLMTNLKMNRLKKRWAQNPGTAEFFLDADAKDSLVDLASYALLTLGTYLREEARVERMCEPPEDTMQIFTEDLCGGDLQAGREEIARLAEEFWTDWYLTIHEGKAEVAKLAEEMMAQDAQSSQITARYDPDDPLGQREMWRAEDEQGLRTATCPAYLPGQAQGHRARKCDRCGGLFTCLPPTTNVCGVCGSTDPTHDLVACTLGDSPSREVSC